MTSRALFVPFALLLSLSGLASEPRTLEARPDYDIAMPTLDVIGDEAYGGRVDRSRGQRPVQASVEVSARSAAEARHKGARWLTAIQNKDGGWGAGAWGSADTSQSDVATTAMVMLALTRDAAGGAQHDEAIKRGAEFVVRAVETSDPNSPRLNTPEGTQPQYKLGQLVDTHMAALVLGEVSGRFDARTNDRVAWALDYVVGKVQLAQQSDGSFDANGWAPVLSTSIAAMGLYKAMEQGVSVREDVLARSDAYQSGNVAADGRVNTAAGAGVDLYVAASSLRNTQAAAARGGEHAEKAQAASEVLTRRVETEAQSLMAGFGSVGGEEMLSYMMISDALAVSGGDTWIQWEKGVASWLVGMQNNDGSWVGHHCITSPVFTTAGAVMTLGAGDAAKATRGGAKAEPRKAELNKTDRGPRGATLVEVEGI